MWNFLNRRGALFGFDARIALGVFAVVGVVAGVATFAAANHAREVARENAVKTAVTAFNQYVHDTKMVPTSFSDFFTNPTVAGWSGPYINGGFKDLGAGEWRFDDYRFGIEQGASSPTGTIPEACTTTSDCYTVLRIASTKAGEMEDLDLKFDGSDSPDTGLVRRMGNGQAGEWISYVFMKGSVKATPTGEIGDGGDGGDGGTCDEAPACGLGQEHDENCDCVECGKGGCVAECEVVELCIGGMVWNEETCACEGGLGEESCGPEAVCLGCSTLNPVTCECEGPTDCGPGGGEEEM